MDAKNNILAVAEDLIKAKGVTGTTVAEIAIGAECAKGLVNYHFGTKKSLVEIVGDRVVQKRIDSWQAALQSDNPQTAIEKSWRLLLSEAREGVLNIWEETIDRNVILTEQTVKIKHQAFSEELGRSASATLAKADLKPRIPMSELGNLLAAVVHGIGKMLSAGINPGELEGAYAAAWLGILSLTQE